ncbi:hypothetical protein ACNOYE_09580 [Nannocystaceae bacterium ST9]
MSEIDPRIERALAELRREWSPPPGSSEAMLAGFHRRLGEGEGGGQPEAGGEPIGGDSIGLAEPAALARVGYVAKLVAATVGMTTAGLTSLWLVGAAISEPRERSSSAAPSPTLAHDAGEPARVEPRTPTPTVAIHPMPPEARPHHESSARPVARARRSSETDLDLAAELTLIRAAEAASPSEAIERLEQHAERFPSGALQSEREGLWILALCELGRAPEAATRASRFFVEHPSSPLIERIERACPSLDSSASP